MQTRRRHKDSELPVLLVSQNAISAILGLGASLRADMRGTAPAEGLVVAALTTILSIVRGNEGTQAEFRKQHRAVMDLVHNCMGSEGRVGRPLLEVVLRIALEKEYDPTQPVPEARLFLFLFAAGGGAAHCSGEGV